MKKLISVIIVIFIAYSLSFYTIGKEKGYKFLDFGINFDNFSSENNSDYEDINEKDLSFEEYFKKGEDFFLSARYDEAIEMFENCLNKEENLDANIYLGRCYLMTENNEQALSIFNSILEKDINNGLPYFYIAYTQNKLGLIEDAINSYYIYLGFFPDDYAAYYNLGLINFENEDYTSAKELFTQSINKNNKYAVPYLERGRSYFMLNEYKKSITDYKQYITLDSTDYTVYFKTGLSYYNLNKYDSAIYFYNIAIDKNPSYNNAYNGLGRIYFKKGDFEKAKFNYLKSIELDRTFYEAYNNLADVYVKEKDYESAIKEYRKVHEFDNLNLYALYSEALCFEQLGNKQQAKQAYQMYLNNATEEHYLYKEAKSRVSKL